MSDLPGHCQPRSWLHAVLHGCEFYKERCVGELPPLRCISACIMPNSLPSL
jgi:hypothetical protein